MFPTNFTDAVESGFLPYILEATGQVSLVNTRATKINAIIKDFKNIAERGYDPNDYIEEVLAEYDLSENDLSEAEIHKINYYVNNS